MGRIVAAAVVLVLVAVGCRQEETPGTDGGPPIKTVFILDFPDVEVGGSATVSTVVRADTKAVFLSPVEVEAPFSSDVVQVEKLEPGESRRIHFIFSPTEPGFYSQDVEVRTTGRVGLYRLQGEAIGGEPVCIPEERVDVHVDVRPTEDLIVVVDDHRSMEAVHDRLLENLLSLPAALDDRGIDWRLAVTTTGVGAGCEGGTLRGEPPVLASGDDGAEAWLKEALAVPTCDGSARGLDAARIVAEDVDGVFRRPHGGLTILAVSTRDDASAGAVAAIAGALQLLVDRPERVRALAIVGDDGGTCPLAEPGRRWAEAVGRLGGMRRSICAEAWELEGFFDARPQFGVPIVYPLQRTPVPIIGEGPIDPAAGDVSVMIEDEPVPYASGRWRYDRATRSVVFFPDSAPLAGQTVEIRYLTCSSP